MAYILTAITGSDTVGQAFRKVNGNLNLQIVSGYTSGNDLILVSRNGTQETISLSTIAPTGNYLALSGGVMDEEAVVQFRNTGGFLNTFVSSTAITFNEDFTNTNINLIPEYENALGDNVEIKFIDTLPSGYAVIVPEPYNLTEKLIGVNQAKNGWDYYTLTGSGIVSVGYGSGNRITIGGGLALLGGGGGIAPITSIVDSSVTQKAFTAGTNISLSEFGGVVTISSPNTITGATNNGSGISVYQSATTNTLAFRTLSAGTNITITTGSTGLITISSTGGGGSGITGVTSAGTGTILLLSGTVVNNNLVQKSILAGTGIGIAEENSTLRIFASGGTGTITSGTSLGGGSNVFSGVSGTNLVFRSLSGSSGMETAESGNLVLVRPLNRTANRVYVTDANGVMVNSGSLQTDNTNGTLGIGVAASTTSRLLLPAQTSTISPLRFTTSSTAISSPTNGDVWYLTAGDTLQFRKNAVTTDFIFKDNNNSLSGSSLGNRVVETSSGGTLSATRFFQSFGVFNSITTTTVTNTTAEVSIIPTGASIIGSATLQALTSITPNLVTGKKYRFTANGNITTKGNPAGNLTARMKIGNAVIASISGFSIHPNITSPNNFFIEASFTIRNASSGGTVVGFGMLQTDHPNLLNNAQAIVGLNNLGQITVDCTTDKVFDFTFQWSTADASNTITINEATLEYLN